MNAYFLRKRNKSLQWLWACAAGMDLIFWVMSGLPSLGSSGAAVLTAAFVLCGLGFPAIIHYALACEYYLRAKEHNKASDVAGVVLLCPLLITPVAVAVAAMCGYGWATHFVVAAVFGPAALPLKLMRDRS